MIKKKRRKSIHWKKEAKKVTMLLSESIVCIVFEFLYDTVISNLVLCVLCEKKKALI